MAYSHAFFDFQLNFALRLAAKFHLLLADALYHYTTFTVSFGSDDWAHYIAGPEQATDPATWTYQWYLARREPELSPYDEAYEGHPLFGCFYFSVQDTTIIRPHFLKNDLPGMRPLSRERLAARQAELRRMFAHIHRHVPKAQTVRGNSWVYNLEAYRRLFPPRYTATLQESEEDEFQYLALWGQCFDYNWNPKPDVTKVLLQRVEKSVDITQLRFCFPYQVCQPQSAIADFYTFFSIT